MALTDEQETRLSNILEACDDRRQDLSEWEQNFLDDQIKRYAQYKSQMFLSGKQWQVLEKMMEKVC